MLEFFIDVARECFNIGNFNSMMAIICECPAGCPRAPPPARPDPPALSAAGMNLSPVARLKKTWSKVKTAKFDVLEVGTPPPLGGPQERGLHPLRPLLRAGPPCRRGLGCPACPAWPRWDRVAAAVLGPDSVRPRIAQSCFRGAVANESDKHGPPRPAVVDAHSQAWAFPWPSFPGTRPSGWPGAGGRVHARPGPHVFDHGVCSFFPPQKFVYGAGGCWRLSI